MGLLESPSSGRYTLAEHEVARLSAAERAHLRNRHIGFIFQSFNLIGDLSVWENVELPLTYRGLAAGERKRRVDQALERVGMGHRKKHMPAQLSGGQQQRVACRRAPSPASRLILLADEPTGNLDSRNGNARVRDLSARAASAGRDDLHGHAQPGICAPCVAPNQPVRRQDRRRNA